jgi:hypothetical protein
MPMTQPPELPHNFVEEVERALEEARRALVDQSARVAALEELHRIGRRVSFELGRPVTVFDVVRQAGDGREREHRRTLIHTLRAD